MTDLVAQIKEIQRKDPVGKAGWIKYCDDFGESKRDPSKHNSEFMQYFINQYEAGEYANLPPAPAVTDGGGAGSSPEGLGMLIKEGQRNAPSFKAAWANFQMRQGQTMNDPMKARKENIVAFLEFISQNAMGGGGGGGWGGDSWGGCWGGKGSGKDFGGGWGPYAGGGGDAWGGPPAGKGGKGGKGGGKGPVSTGDPQKDGMVEKIKAFQRSGEENKQAWWAFCDEHCGGKRDPARHEMAELHAFISQYGI